MKIIYKNSIFLLIGFFLIHLTAILARGSSCDILYFISSPQGLGYIDCKGKVVVEPVYSYASDFQNGVGKIRNEKGETGIVTLSGKIVYFTPFELLSNFSDDLALAKTPDNKYAFLTKEKVIKFFLPSNVLIIEREPMVSNFSEGIATISLDNGSVLFVNKGGKTLFTRSYDYVADFSDGIATVEFGDKGAVIDKRGRYILKPRVVDRQDGKIIFAPLDGIVRVQEGERKWKYFDNKGRVLLKTNFDYCGDFIDGLAKVSRNEKYGFINKKGKLVVPLIYDYADDFSDGLASVEINNKIGFINNKGKLVIQLTNYDSANSFKNGLAYVSKNNEEGYINKLGNWVWKKKTE